MDGAPVVVYVANSPADSSAALAMTIRFCVTGATSIRNYADSAGCNDGGVALEAHFADEHRNAECQASDDRC